MDKNALYKQQNESFLETIAREPGVKQLAGGVMYQPLKTGEGASPAANSIVSVYYKGTLINGKVFDDNTRQGYPDAFRLNELIAGWQIALRQMRTGDQWRIYIPAKLGYGSMSTPGIPKNSTLIFEIELVSIG